MSTGGRCWRRRRRSDRQRRRRWFELDPMEILESVKVCTGKTLDKETTEDIILMEGLKAIMLLNQREAAIFWNKFTVLRLFNWIIWMESCTSSVYRLIPSRLVYQEKDDLQCLFEMR